MRDLFVMDAKDYHPDGKVFCRPSARAVIERDGKVLLMYSRKFDYFKFPGGGISDGESREEALIREVREESGRVVLPDSIEEFGRVLRRHRDDRDPHGIFEQENFYYFCEISEEEKETCLDDYEAQEGFTPVWVKPFEASLHNRYREKGDVDQGMIDREAKVLDMVDLELLGRARKAHEEETIRALGDLDYAGMLKYVGSVLEEGMEKFVGGKQVIRYSRFEHTKRVLAWAKRLFDGYDWKEELRYEELMIATIFHDVGKAEEKRSGIPHARASASITRQYLLTHGFDEERTEYICSLVEAHSDKRRMSEPDLDKNLLLLMEADLLDDMGAAGIVMDCMVTESRNPQAVFTDCLDHIMRYTWRQQQDNPMVSAAARKIWEKKTKLTEAFADSLREDLCL